MILILWGQRLLAGMLKKLIMRISNNNHTQKASELLVILGEGAPIAEHQLVEDGKDLFES